ncbi:5023_t:CDS:2 [Entrophospora sp. SA101]|nr:5022_t:CDS:2 [Entrophospora sp. SA101]CAJ0766905.1 5023_t:CDS:2 [Entrophospora sp. SA101]CAJ0866277.1 12870_t:CDS:2 [Entrophospora sp. SA101]CAJ0909141.1 9968_t:CDS:2 [Entrophospora sp. SA101]
MDHGGFSSSFPGYASGPKKQLYQELKRRCTTRLVNEFKTSQCKNPFQNPQKIYSSEFAVMAMECCGMGM